MMDHAFLFFRYRLQENVHGIIKVCSQTSKVSDMLFDKNLECCGEEDV